MPLKNDYVNSAVLARVVASRASRRGRPGQGLLGDLVSLYIAVLRGVDPTPVDVIEELKGRPATGA